MEARRREARSGAGFGRFAEDCGRVDSSDAGLPERRRVVGKFYLRYHPSGF